MDIKDYKFEIGDKVITTEGEVGRITKICKCEECEKRGFYEPIWTIDGSDYEEYITIWQAKSGFKGFYQIGKYRFNDFDKSYILQQMASCLEQMANCEKELKQLKEKLEFIEGLMNE